MQRVQHLSCATQPLQHGWHASQHEANMMQLNPKRRHTTAVALDAAPNTTRRKCYQKRAGTTWQVTSTWSTLAVKEDSVSRHQLNTASKQAMHQPKKARAHPLPPQATIMQCCALDISVPPGPGSLASVGSATTEALADHRRNCQHHVHRRSTASATEAELN
jgi:phosphoribosylformylglycinamidine (FGAM) synthase-like enzyme